MSKFRNITLAIDAEVYRKVQVWCAFRDISISRVVRTFLNDLPRMDNVRRFPTPEAPFEGSLAEEFDELTDEDIELLRSQMR